MSPILSATNRIQNQTFENLNLLSRKTGATSASPILKPLSSAQAEQGREGEACRNQDIRPSLGTPLPMVIEACPDILDYIPAGKGRGFHRRAGPSS
jgi:hypothetical protein